MPSKLNKHTYQKLIDENIAWLLSLPKCCERDHVIHIVRDSVKCYYPEKDPS